MLRAPVQVDAARKEGVMARVLLLQRDMPVNVVYSVDQAVGAGCLNRRDDVLLVQFLFRIIREDSFEDGKRFPGFRPPGEAPIDIDGVCGAQTNKYIRFFEAEVNRQREGDPDAMKMVIDGRVDPIASGTPFGSLSGKIYKIWLMNLLYAGVRGKAAHEKIFKDPSFPKELTKSLFIA
jgi:hypothetical protein